MRILLVQLGFLGDVILSTPLIEAIHLIHPGCELWMMTTPAASPLIREDPMLSGSLEFDKRASGSGIVGIIKTAKLLRKMKFDRVYSLHRSFRTSLTLALSRIPLRVGFKESRAAFLYTNTVTRKPVEHDVLRNLSLLDPVSNIQKFSGSMRIYAGNNLSPHSIFSLKPSYIVLSPGSVWRTKRWSVTGYREVAEHFLRIGLEVVVVGSMAEREIADQVCNGLSVINLAGRTTLAELSSIVRESSLVVCNDSMCLHLASAHKIPTVAIFCATSPKFGFGPWQNENEIVERNDLDCKPCRRHGSNRCPTGTESCMNGLAASPVIRACEKLLNERTIL